MQARRSEPNDGFDAAAELYRRALGLDMLAEALYRRLMLCQRGLGENAEALETYRRWRHALSVVLGGAALG